MLQAGFSPPLRMKKAHRELFPYALLLMYFLS